MNNKSYFILIVVLVHLKLFGQQPYIINSNGQLSDGFFNFDCDNTSITDCNTYNQVECVNWDSSTDIPSISHFSCLGLSPQQLGNSHPNFCLLKHNLHYITGDIMNLIPGQNYQLKFYQTMYSGDKYIPAPYLSCDDLNENGQTLTSLGYFRIELGSISFNSPNITCTKNDTAGLEQIVFEFTAPSNNQNTVNIKIFPVNIDNSNFSLAISSIQIICTDCQNEPEEPEEPELPVYNPEDVVIVSTPCADCTSFELIRNEEYVVSAWMKRTDNNDSSLYLTSYNNNYSETDNAFLKIEFASSNNEIFNFFPSGEIIEGWQRINGTFKVPLDANEILIHLKNLTTDNAYFDDIRIHPVNSNLKSFVYDQYTNRLMAELDENNYSTYYEYDNEGGLVRVKKETERGIFTIQETRSSSIKR